MINNNSSLQIHNKFELQLYDIDGNIQQEAYAYNAANSLKFMLASTGLTAYNVGGPSDDYSLSYIRLGDGDVSTNPPKETDRYLVHGCFSAEINNYEFKRTTPFTKEYQRIEYQSAEHTFPPTRDYIADLTEIGLVNSHNQCFSHAALVDAEGKPIIIKKTEYNELKVKCTIYITPILAISNSELKFKFFPAYSSVLGGCIAYYETDPTVFYNQNFPSVRGGTRFYFSPQYVPESYDGIIYDNPMFTRERLSNDLISTNWKYNQKMSYDSTTLDFSPVFPIINYKNNVLLTPTQHNFGFAHSIVFPNFGAIALPNEKIIPKYTLDVAIGEGDGEKTVFYTSVNELAVDENEKPILKVYFQNSEDGEKSLVDSSNYTFTNFTAKKSPLWNKMIYVENKSTGEQIEKGTYFMNDPNASSNRNLDQCFFGYCALTNFSFGVKKSTSSSWDGFHEFFAPGGYWDAVYYDEQGITLDEGKIGSYGDRYYAGGNYYSYNNPSLVLFYKDLAEEDWSEEKKIVIPPSSTDVTQFLVTKFEPITAKYWKLQMSGISYSQNANHITAQGSNRLNKCNIVSGSSASNSLYEQHIMGIDPNFIIVGNSAEYDFAKVGLEFKTPPPAGTIITMEATLDLPYKTPDGSMTFSYQSSLNPPNSGA